MCQVRRKSRNTTLNAHEKSEGPPPSEFSKNAVLQFIPKFMANYIYITSTAPHMTCIYDEQEALFGFAL